MKPTTKREAEIRVRDLKSESRRLHRDMMDAMMAGDQWNYEYYHDEAWVVDNEICRLCEKWGIQQ